MQQLLRQRRICFRQNLKRSRIAVTYDLARFLHHISFRSFRDGGTMDRLAVPIATEQYRPDGELCADV
ncbi:hypothetical protein A8M32_02180 [Sinorhizobium alkalisoli]|uniref:Uncharacterized protein n=1 Tax=Sinorhizobium alkalisoli TaxID=1752398 RepID=A0A1E3VH90_9HYPH|nr:hypothetical protein A8M32_02180 [Sinorhizobium alkalisoli]